MRIVLWHGWLLEGSGSNIATARVAEVLRAAGHDVLLLCQERHPERYPWIDAVGAVGPDGVAISAAETGGTSAGRCVLLRPDIGPLLPVFVIDAYEGFATVKTFLELTPDELDTYLARNVDALRTAAEWHESEVAIAGHAIPGAAVARRALGEGAYITKVHGSDVEYALRPQLRYRDLAGEGLRAARAVIGPSADVLARLTALVPGVERLGRILPPGVDAGRFRPQPRRKALLEAAGRLDAEAATIAGGRPEGLDAEVAHALADRDAEALDALARRYDQAMPDTTAASTLRAVAERDLPLVGYFGKLIPQKGVELLLQAARATETDPDVLVVGFGLHREWLTALRLALAGEGLAWLEGTGRLALDPQPGPGQAGRDGIVSFTGRLDHRFAPGVLAAMDVLVVPSILEEAFGMVAAEGAAAGALPLVARHSGLAEVASALEREVGVPDLFSFEPGPRA
ncbi:MAG TPA: glycosyltransferase, partial [Actinomycetota bacterium]|nr:glycosyltransferase [Actinomycetota bacterium]